MSTGSNFTCTTTTLPGVTREHPAGGDQFVDQLPGKPTLKVGHRTADVRDS